MGFDFGAAKKAEPLPAKRGPLALRGAFPVSVARHWAGRAQAEAGAVHARFLEQLTTRLRLRPDMIASPSAEMTIEAV